MTLSGSIGGDDGEIAAQQIEFRGTVGSGAYTFNGFSIFPGVLVASNGQTFTSGIALEANSQSATVANSDQSLIAGSASFGTAATTVESNPGQLAFSQDWTFGPAVVNAFDSNFVLVSIQTDAAPDVDAELAVDLPGDIQTDSELANVVLQDQETQTFLGDFWSYVSQPTGGF